MGPFVNIGVCYSFSVFIAPFTGVSIVLNYSTVTDSKVCNCTVTNFSVEFSCPTHLQAGLGHRIEAVDKCVYQCSSLSCSASFHHLNLQEIRNQNQQSPSSSSICAKIPPNPQAVYCFTSYTYPILCSQTTLLINAPDGSHIINQANQSTLSPNTSYHALNQLYLKALLQLKEKASKGWLQSSCSMKCNGCNTVLKLEPRLHIQEAAGHGSATLLLCGGKWQQVGGTKKQWPFLGAHHVSSFIAAERVIGDWWRQQLEELVHERSRVRGEEISN